MTGHPPDSEELLFEVSAGLRPERDPEVQRLLIDPAARERLAQLRAAVTALDDAGATARSVMRRAETLQRAPGDERVDEVVRGLAAAEPGSGRPARDAAARPPWMGYVLLAAAAVVAVLGARWLGAGEPSPSRREGPRLLGDESLVLLRPRETFGDGAVFQWRGELAPGERFRVRVFDAADPLAFAPALESPTTVETRWTPSDAETRELPEEIRWTVERIGPDGAARTSAEAFSRRSPR